MRLSREWLSEYTDIKASDREYAARMTMTGSKVENTEITGAGISGTVAGKIISVEKHPDADRLLVCKADVGSAEAITVVTGASNMKEGDFVPVAKDEATLPGGKTIKSGAIRGIVSEGMFCSLKELGLDIHDYPYADEDGIFVIEEPCKPGDDMIKVLGLGDSVAEFEITNNRPDCFSVIGLARESAATFDTALTLRKPAPPEGCGNIKDYLSVEVKDPDLCPRYTARVIKNISVKPSPAWMRRRLRACGVRPINNIVDVTNYVMLEYGQPMHAFDLSCVSGNKIIVRRAARGEVLQTLDGSEHRLTEKMLLIADETKPIGAAGVMGGLNSEITEKTTAVVLESATFNGASVRKTSIALGVRTDASSRFEKGLDTANTLPAIDRACELIRRIDAGETVAGTLDIFARAEPEVSIKLEPGRINALLGADISEEFMIKTLKKLGFQCEDGVVTVPSVRGDVRHCADLAEEVARFYGYDRIEATPVKGDISTGGFSEKQKFEIEIDRTCRAVGFSEIVTYSFGSASAFDKIRLSADAPQRRAMVILNPLGEDRSVMRTTSLPSMLEALSVNCANRCKDVKLYETAKVYLPSENSPLADERKILTLGAYGGEADFFGVKGRVEAVFEALRIKNVRFEAMADNPSYHPGRCAVIKCKDATLGVVGMVHPAVCDAFSLNIPICAAEIDTEKMFACRDFDIYCVPLPRFPAIERDLAIVCDAAVPVAGLRACIFSAGGEYLEQCELFDVYTGAPIPEGMKSAAFSLAFRANDRTLTDDIADRLLQSILDALKDECGAVMR
ncbi:MAG: phenylalanine--tRNA ligase subunit beta [Oscillospiraceae bacterium]|nr:phenylalanine--tRNA ligase subunit beta [Oscillospiraceae bacterium]